MMTMLFVFIADRRKRSISAGTTSDVESAEAKSTQSDLPDHPLAQAAFTKELSHEL
jgi:hypothetical protein